MILIDNENVKIQGEFDDVMTDAALMIDGIIKAGGGHGDDKVEKFLKPGILFMVLTALSNEGGKEVSEEVHEERAEFYGEIVNMVMKTIKESGI